MNNNTENGKAYTNEKPETKNVEPDWAARRKKEMALSKKNKKGKSVDSAGFVWFPGVQEVTEAEAIKNAIGYPPLKLYTVYTNYNKYIEFFDKEDNLICFIWALGTHCFEIFDYYPILQINAPKNSGKTKLCTILGKCSRKEEVTQNCSSAYLFRTIQDEKPTLIIDDMEILSNKEKAEDVLSVLRAGWYRGGVTGRINVNTHAREKFNVYCPKVVSNITGVSDDALQSRSVPISLIRSSNKDILNLDITPLGNDDTHLAWALSVLWVNNHWKRIKEVYETLEVSDLINGRDRQLWKPLLSIAKVIDETDKSIAEGFCYNLLESYAIKKVDEVLDNDVDSVDMKVLYALKDVVQLEKYYYLDDIKCALDVVVDNQDIGYSIKRLKLDSGKKRSNRGNKYWLSPDMVNDKFERYCKK